MLTTGRLNFEHIRPQVSHELATELALLVSQFKYP